MIKAYSILCFAALALLDSASAPATKLQVLTLTAKHDHKTFSVLKGTTVVVKLSFHSGTAYAWQPTKVPEFMTEVKGAATTVGAVKMPGGALTRVFKFTTTGKGTGVLSFALTAGVSSHPPAKTFSVTLNANE